MALKAYTLDLALQTSSEFAIGNTIPNVAGIATDGKGFIPTKNSINKTITLSKGFGKFDGRLFELTEQTVYSWDAGSTDADAYLVIDLTKQNSFTGTIEDGTYTFVDNQSSIVISSTQPEPSANTQVYKLDGNYNTMTGWLNAYIKKSNELPAIARDFGYLAQHMQEYQGFWWNGAESVANSPADNWTWSVIEVIPGNAGSNGVIRTMRTGDGIVYSTNINFGYIQHWTRFANDANVLHNTGNETASGDKTFTGTLDAAQKIYTRTIGTTNDLQIIYTRAGNVVTGRYTAAKAGTFKLSNNDGYKAPTAYPVNIISQNINAWFTVDNRFHTDTVSTGNFVFITNDPLPV